MILDIAEGINKIYLKSESSYIKTLAVTDDSNYMAFASSDREIKIWNISENTECSLFHGHTKEITCFVLASDSKYLITGSYDKTVRVWNLLEKSQAFILRGHEESVDCLGITKDNNLIYSCSCEDLIIWNAKIKENSIQGTRLKSGTLHNKTLAISNEKAYIVSGLCDNTVRVWKIRVQNLTL